MSRPRTSRSLGPLQRAKHPQACGLQTMPAWRPRLCSRNNPDAAVCMPLSGCPRGGGRRSGHHNSIDAPRYLSHDPTEWRKTMKRRIADHQALVMMAAMFSSLACGSSHAADATSSPVSLYISDEIQNTVTQYNGITGDFQQVLITAAIGGTAI